LIGLYPDRLLWLRHDARLRVRDRHNVAVVTKPGQPRWAAAVAALSQELATAKAKRARATVVLSNHFVRHMLVPWSVHAADDAQRCEMARYGFARIYGPAVEDWSVQVSDGGIGAFGVASAVDRALLSAVDAAGASARVRIDSVQPHLMAAFNRFHARLGRRPHWFALVEPAALCVALLARGRWQRLVCRRSDEDWAKALCALLMQETCLGGAAAAAREVLVYAPGMAARRIGVPGEWRVRYLSPTSVYAQTSGPPPAAVGS
jgi:hypothetical protein